MCVVHVHVCAGAQPCPGMPRPKQDVKSIHLHFIASKQDLSLNLSFGQVGWQASKLCVFSALYLTYRCVQPWPDVNEGAGNLNSGPWVVSSALKNFILEILQGWSSVDRFPQFLFI